MGWNAPPHNTIAATINTFEGNFHLLLCVVRVDHAKCAHVHSHSNYFNEKQNNTTSGICFACIMAASSDTHIESFNYHLRHLKKKNTQT